jgi:hypothetical protein
MNSNGNLPLAGFLFLIYLGFFTSTGYYTSSFFSSMTILAGGSGGMTIFSILTSSLVLIIFILGGDKSLSALDALIPTFKGEEIL